MQWQCDRPFVVCAPRLGQRSQQAFCRCSQHHFLAPNVAPEHARANVVVVVPSFLVQVLTPVSRQSPFQPWVLVRAFCFCFWSSGLARQRHVQSPRCRRPPRLPHRRVDVRAWRVHSYWHLRLLFFSLPFGAARGRWGSPARGKSPACHRRFSHPCGIVHVLRPSVVRHRDRADISICEL